MSELLSEAAALRLFEFVDRKKTDMPADYLPQASGVLFAGDDILKAVGHIVVSYRPRGWIQEQPGNYRKRVGKYVLMVRQCGGPKSEHWTIERFEFSEYKGTEALVFPFGDYVPIWARTYQAAMRLAEYCYPIPRPPVCASWEVARVQR